jgi:adenine specific DNA methylase Mod
MLIHGDNLEALGALLAEKERGRLQNADGTPGVRLVYMDPPFASGGRYRTGTGRHAFGDRLRGKAFIEFMRARLVILKDILAEDGSVYLHLDWRMSHHMRVLMDEVFGEENFLNEIIWHYGGRGAKAVAHRFARNHDTILLYRKKGHVFNRLTTEKKVAEGAKGFSRDNDGRWFKTAPRGDYTDKSIERLEKEGRIYRTRTGRIRIKYFLREENGKLFEEKLVGDVWDDIPDGMHLPGAEKTGYPTQKPEALLMRVIGASSNAGDLVLDAFAGSGTTLVAAQKLGRKWIGMDKSELAVETMEKRLAECTDARFTLYRVRP